MLTLKSGKLLALCIAPGLLAACAAMPTGPTAMALPGSGKNFEQFRGDDFTCRDYAQYQLGGNSPQQASVDSGVRSAALGTLIGALAGAAIDGGRGAGTGAATGLAIGTVAGVGAGNASAYGMQRRYDDAYQQCMYAKGNKVPVAGMFDQMPATAAYPPPNAATPPPNMPPQ
ncbi:outer membrane lipoprotein SlyB [Oxalobacteraceae bacterium GrIS 1.11]